MKKTLIWSHLFAASILSLAFCPIVSAQTNLLTNGDFEADAEGTVAGGIDGENHVDVNVITGWRAFAVAGALGNSTVTSAAGRSGKGVELQRLLSDPAGDSALDRDNGDLYVNVPTEARVYKFTVDARDGGPLGGTTNLRMEFQFSDPGFNKSAVFDPGAEFGTYGFSTTSNDGGTISTRFDLSQNLGSSVHIDNASLVDATENVNRLINGGFENTAGLSNWRYFDTAEDAGNSGTISTDANSGSQAALLTVANAPGVDIGLDLEPHRAATTIEETLTIAFAAKNFSDTLNPNSRLFVKMAAFDTADPPNHLGDFFAEVVNPGTAGYESYSFEAMTPFGTERINVAFRVSDEGGALATGAYLIDDVSLSRGAVISVGVPGDANGDGNFDFGDIEAFFLALTDSAAYAAQYPDVAISLLDMNSDGNTDFGDIEAFFAALTGG